MAKNEIGIIGFGRFGEVLAGILKDDFEIFVYDVNNLKQKAERLGVNFSPLEKTLGCNTIFYAVPISKFENVLKSHLPYFKKSGKPKLLIDALSVKVYPKKIFQKYLPENFEALLTHPLFGPDSLNANGLKDMPIVINKLRVSEKNFLFWKNYFKSKKLKVFELSAEQHDRMAAYSQGLTHFIGRILENMDMKPIPIDTFGARKLLEIKEQTCNDTWELFKDLQIKNPYTKEMRLKLDKSIDNIYSKLLPDRIDRNIIIIGVQGGKGSFNDEAAHTFLKKAGIKKYRIKYFYTSENVLKALHQGEIDRGQFAIYNSTSGAVNESISAMAKYKFKILEEFPLKISISMMMRPDASIGEIDTIITHPQTFKQCRNNLSKKYPKLQIKIAKGNMMDPANVARRLQQKKLPKNIATMGGKTLAEIYNLKIVEENLQDFDENYTTFLLVKRY